MTARQRRPTVLGNTACSGLAEIRLWEMIGLLGMSLPSIIRLLLRPGDLLQPPLSGPHVYCMSTRLLTGVPQMVK